MKHKLNIIIAENDPAQAELLTSYLHDLRPDWRVVALPKSASEVLDVLDKHTPHLFFLSLELAGHSSGLDVAREVAQVCPVIFMTHNPAHAVAAFDVGAVDFLLQPIHANRLEQALERAEGLVDTNESANSFDDDESTEPTQGRVGAWARYLQLTNGRKLIWTSTEEVRYVYAEQKYTRVILESTSGLIRRGLLAVHKRLNPADFWQIHRSTVVNAKYIEEVSRDELGRLIVKVKGSNQPLVVSRNKESLFRDDFFR